MPVPIQSLVIIGLQVARAIVDARAAQNDVVPGVEHHVGPILVVGPQGGGKSRWIRFVMTNDVTAKVSPTRQVEPRVAGWPNGEPTLSVVLVDTMGSGDGGALRRIAATEARQCILVVDGSRIGDRDYDEVAKGSAREIASFDRLDQRAIWMVCTHRDLLPDGATVVTDPTVVGIAGIAGVAPDRVLEAQLNSKDSARDFTDHLFTLIEASAKRSPKK